MVCCRRCVLTVTLSRPIPLIVTRWSFLQTTQSVMVHLKCTDYDQIHVSVMVAEIRALPVYVCAIRSLRFSVSVRKRRK